MTLPALSLTDADVNIPQVGFGCAFGNWTGDQEFQGFLPDQAWRSVQLALDAGYRHFDVAHCYGTERQVGDVLGRALADGQLTREDLFLTTKIAHPPAPPHVAISQRRTFDWFGVPDLKQRVLNDVDVSKEKLGVGQIDLLLMHWPGMFDNKDPVRAADARLEVWEAMEELFERGDARAIGVCNFAPKHLQELIDAKRRLPMVNQVEVHPYCQDTDLSAFCKEQKILLEAYAPFASGAFGLLRDPVLAEIAQELDRSTGQVILRWHVQQGHVVLPKSGNPVRMKQNLTLFDFELNEEQMHRISALNPAELKRTTASPYDII